jgi:hypothetical protein
MIDSSDFKFLDDFKLSLLKDLKFNEMLVDPDILMFKKPMVDSNTDLIFDYKDSPRKYWYEEDIRAVEGMLLYDKIKSVFESTIGFLNISISGSTNISLNFKSLSRLSLKSSKNLKSLESIIVISLDRFLRSL